MKTAQQTYEHILMESPNEAVFLIQKYAREIAEQTLKDAARRLQSDKTSIKRIILSTQIETP